MPGPIYACRKLETARQYIYILSKYINKNSQYMSVLFKIRLDKTGIVKNKEN